LARVDRDEMDISSVVSSITKLSGIEIHKF
jgi:hypothetical protein